MKIKPKTGDFFCGKIHGYREDFIIISADKMHFYHDLSEPIIAVASLISSEKMVNFGDGYHETWKRKGAFLNSDMWEYMGNIYE